MRLCFGFTHYVLCRRAAELAVNCRKILSYFETRGASAIDCLLRQPSRSVNVVDAVASRRGGGM